jgi:hypothetical protein
MRDCVRGPRPAKCACWFYRPDPGLWPQRRYELHFPHGKCRVVTLRQLDTILNGRSFPADFWAAVEAADAAFAAGDRDALIEWPSGRRAALA